MLLDPSDPSHATATWSSSTEGSPPNSNGGGPTSHGLWSARVHRRARADRANARRLLRAGAEVAITASYQAKFEGSAARGTDEEGGAALMRASVLLARRARDAWVAAAPPDTPRPLVPPPSDPTGRSGGWVGYTGDYERRPHSGRSTLRRLESWPTPMPAPITAHRAIPSIQEAAALADALAEHPGCRLGELLLPRRRRHPCDGTRSRRRFHISVVPNVVAVGVNCTAPAHIESLVRHRGRRYRTNACSPTRRRGAA